MKNVILLFFIFYSSCLFAQENSVYYDSIARYDSIAHLKHQHPLPLSCSRIKAGYSNDSIVSTLYGQGLFDSKDGHGGARYFVDPLKKVILKTVIGTDAVIEEVGLSLFDYPFDFAKDKLDSLPVAKNLSINPLMIRGIKFGDSKEKVIKAYGLPNRDKKENNIRILHYEDNSKQWADVLFYSAVFEFKENKLQRISIYNGE